MSNFLIAADRVGIRSRNLNASIASSKFCSTSTWRRMVRGFMVYFNVYLAWTVARKSS